MCEWKFQYFQADMATAGAQLTNACRSHERLLRVLSPTGQFPLDRSCVGRQAPAESGLDIHEE